MWTNYSSFRPGNSFFPNVPSTQAFGNPFARGGTSFGNPFGNDLFSMGGNSSIPMAQMLPVMMAAIIQQQLALMFLAELLSMGGGQRNNQNGGCGCGQSNGRFPNRGWGGHRRMPPGSWGRTNGAGAVHGTPDAVYSGGTGNVANGTASFDSVRNQGARNQMVSGRVTVNGNTYRFNSGGGGRGSLPPGQYRITKHMMSRGDRTMSVGGVGYSFAMSDKYDPRVGGNRSLLRIHPDGGGAGTIGCMGIVGNAATQAQFRRDMAAEIDRNGGSFTLNVGVAAQPDSAATTNTPINGTSNGGTNVTGNTSASAGRLNSQLGGVFAGQGQAFVNAAQRHGMDPNLLAAIAMHETGNGTSNAVRNYNNPGGLMNPRTNWSTLQRFGSLEQGLDRMASNLKRNYLDKGLTNIGAIGRKYAPVGAANDPRGLNGHWVSNVTRLYHGLS